MADCAMSYWIKKYVAPENCTDEKTDHECVWVFFLLKIELYAHSAHAEYDISYDM